MWEHTAWYPKRSDECFTQFAVPLVTRFLVTRSKQNKVCVQRVSKVAWRLSIIEVHIVSEVCDHQFNIVFDVVFFSNDQKFMLRLKKSGSPLVEKLFPVTKTESQAPAIAV